MTEASKPNDKVVLAVSLLAIFATMYGYRDSLNQIELFPSFSIYNLLIYMSLLLFLSIYFSSLANLRYSYKKLEKSNWLDKCDRSAEILYLVAIILLPTTFFGGYLVSNIILGLTSFLFSQNSMYDYAIISITATIISVLVIKYINEKILDNSFKVQVILGLITNFISSKIYSYSKNENKKNEFKK